jgi:subtilase family serine protease
LHVGALSANRLLVKVSASAAVAERAFHTELRRYRLPSGARFYLNVSAPLIPAAVANSVQAIAGLSDLPLWHQADIEGPGPAEVAHRSRYLDLGDTVPGGPQPCAQATQEATSSGPYTADEIASAYGFSDLYSAGDLGAGQTVAVFELEPFDAADVRTYDECYYGATQGTTMSSPPQLNVISVDGGVGAPGATIDVESTLDVEEISAFVPAAVVDVYEGPNTDTGPLDVYNSIVTQDRAKVITTSWGACESQAGGRSVVAAEANLFEEAAAQGQTMIAASGDEGSSDCTDASDNPIPSLAVDDPGSQPYVTSVGGTSMPSLGSPASATMPVMAPTQVVWNSDNGAGGGGISSDWAMPAYQLYAAPALAVVKSYSSGKPCAAPTGFCREVPDVSADADPNTGLVIHWSGWGGWSTVGGTSIAAPMWAALVTLADASPACKGIPVGFLNPTLYWIAGMASDYATAFYDVTEGDNYLPGMANWWQYPATVGYDLASGLGTPTANDVGGGLDAMLCSLPASGGAAYASPTRSSITAVLNSVKAKATASSWIKVTLRTALGLPIAAKRVILVATVTPSSAAKVKIQPVTVTTNAKGVAIFQVSDTLIQKVTYQATDLTDGVLLNASATVSYVKP